LGQESVRIIHVADTHIDPTVRYLGPKEQERRRDFLRAFEHVVKKTLELKPDLLLISGDLFDRVNPRNPARTQVMRGLRRLYNEGIRIYAIGGNHDTPRSVEEGASPLHELEAAGYVKFFSKTGEIEADNIDVHGLKICISGASYNHTIPLDRDPLETMRIPREGDVNIVMLHYNFSSVKIPPIWRAPTIKETSIPRDVHYLALGHYHCFRKISLGRTLVVYPGSTERRSFAEENEKKGFVYVELNEERVKNPEYIETNPRPLKTLKITISENEENPVNTIVSVTIKHTNRQAILRLIIKGRLSQEQLTRYNRDQILRQLENHFFHVIIDDRELEYVLEQPELEGFEMLSPLKLYEDYLVRLIQDAGNSSKKRKILEGAFNLGKKFLEEAGAW